MSQYVRPPVSGTIRTSVPRSSPTSTTPQRRLHLGQFLFRTFTMLAATLTLGLILMASIIACQGGFVFLHSTSIPEKREPPPIVTSEEESHGDTLQEVLANIRYEPYEIFVAFDSCGVKLFEFTNYDYNTVAIPQQLLRYYQDNDGAFIVHNHPSEEGPFSFPDLETACVFDAEATIVTTYNYDIYLKPNQSGWPQPSDLFRWQREHHSNTADGEYWVSVHTVDSKTGITHVGLSTTDKLIQLFADEFDLTFYKTEPLSGVDYTANEITAPY